MAHIPYGYKIVNGSAVIDPDQRRQIIRLYQCFLGGATYQECQAYSGIRRTPKGCRAILTDTTYLGTDFYPQLIPAELFQKASEEYLCRPQGHGGRKKRVPVKIHTVFFFDLCSESLMSECIQAGNDSYHLQTIYKHILCDPDAASQYINVPEADKVDFPDVHQQVRHPEKCFQKEEQA